MPKKIICIFFSVLLALSFSACSKTSAWANKPFNKKADSKELQNETVVAENEKYRLEWVARNCSVSLVDKQTGQTWGTTPVSVGEPEVDMFGLPIKKHPMVESAIVVEYLNNSTDIEEQAVSYTASVNEGRIIAEKIKGGVKVEYYFDAEKIMVPVEYILRENGVSVSVDAKEIQEDSSKVTSISIMPFWCSVKNDSEDSYLFIPSGSGALTYAKTISQTGLTYSEQVYGKDPVMAVSDSDVTKKSVRLPVYGAKNGDTAVCAIIENSSESAVIEAKVGSSAIGYSGVYAKFQVRGYSPNLAKFMQGLEKQLNIYSQSMVDSKMTVAFYPLTGESADYSGMANVYKCYLKDSGLMKPISDDSTLNITIVGGALITKSLLGIPYKDVLPATTISQAMEILKEISQRTEAKINARLIGFGEHGLARDSYAGGFKINNNLGNLKNLSELSEYCKNNNISLYFDFDLLSLKKNDAGYNKMFDTAYSSLNKIANVYDYNVASRSRIEDSKYYLLKRELLTKSAEKLLNKIKNWDLEGISLSSLSSIAYSDYSNKSVKYYSKGGMPDDVTAIIESVSKNYRLASCDANVYAAVKSDTIYESPTCSSGELIFSEDIPFYQMIFKGYVNMSGQSMNIAASPEKQLLKAIESGSSLGYTICAEWHNEFIDYNGYEFFGSEYNGIKNSMIDTYMKIADFYKNINGAQITENNILQNGLRETVFSNGVIAYVNYSDEAKTSPIGQIESGNFACRGTAK